MSGEESQREYVGADRFLVPGAPEYHAGDHPEQELAAHREQRAARGWSSFDLWNGDGYLAHVIGAMAGQHRKDRHSHPSSMTPGEWDSILAQIGEPLLAYATRKSEETNDPGMIAAAKKALHLFADHFDHFWD